MAGKDFRFGISSGVSGVDLNKLLVAHPLSTYFMRIASDIPELGLLADDVAVVDRSLKPKKKDLVVVSELDSPELKVVRFEALQKELDFWGVIEHIIRKVKA